MVAATVALPSAAQIRCPRTFGFAALYRLAKNRIDAAETTPKATSSGRAMSGRPSRPSMANTWRMGKRWPSLGSDHKGRSPRSPSQNGGQECQHPAPVKTSPSRCLAPPLHATDDRGHPPSADSTPSLKGESNERIRNRELPSTRAGQATAVGSHLRNP